MTPSEVVVDSSVVIFALTGGGDTSTVRERLRTAIHAPHLIDAEIGSVLRRHELAGSLDPAEAAAALKGARLLISHRYPHDGTLSDYAWTLRHNLTFYDALFVALATRLGLPLLTADARLAHAPGVTCVVELV